MTITPVQNIATDIHLDLMFSQLDLYQRAVSASKGVVGMT